MARFLRKNRCPHVVIYGLYGEVAEVTRYRLFCPACKTFLDGDVDISTQVHPIHSKSGAYPLVTDK